MKLEENNIKSQILLEFVIRFIYELFRVNFQYLIWKRNLYHIIP